MHIFEAGDDRILYGSSAERDMIRRTFLLLPGIGQLKERRLWESGVLSWEEFFERRHLTGISVQRKECLDQELGTATVVITHNAAIAGMADRVVRLADGRIVGVERNTTKVKVQDLQW